MVFPYGKSPYGVGTSAHWEHADKSFLIGHMDGHLLRLSCNCSRGACMHRTAPFRNGHTLACNFQYRRLQSNQKMIRISKQFPNIAYLMIVFFSLCIYELYK